ncbi:uncharacterized protein METZ01_LOCUS170257 [marine metagenome]|uniref:Gamma-butyrobetaine hydroxylase-like N-terminal domain-containing protein n=1 Tax=marine metagenome TaxID=408172 RepID=A0A382BWG7_9ZZZZ
MTENTLHPLTIFLHKQSRVLEIVYNDGLNFKLPCEYLRVFSPSADVKGHGPGQEVLQLGKEDVNIKEVEPVGNYAVRLIFDDGHETGLYTWNYLYELGQNQKSNWIDYLHTLNKSGHKRKQDG